MIFRRWSKRLGSFASRRITAFRAQETLTAQLIPVARVKRVRVPQGAWIRHARTGLVLPRGVNPCRGHTFFYPADATEDLIESRSGITESPSLKKIFTCSRNGFLWFSVLILRSMI